MTLGCQTCEVMADGNSFPFDFFQLLLCAQLPANNVNNNNNKNNCQHLNNVMIWGINNKLTLGHKVNVRTALPSPYRPRALGRSSRNGLAVPPLGAWPVAGFILCSLPPRVQAEIARGRPPGRHRTRVVILTSLSYFRE